MFFTDSQPELCSKCVLRKSSYVYKKKYKSNFVSILDVFVSRWKNWPLLRGYFGSWERALVAVAVVERFKQELLYGLSAGTKKSGRCREVAVKGGLTVFQIVLVFHSILQ